MPDRDYSYCPVCGITVSVPPGSSCPPHQPIGERAACPGAGGTTT